MYEVLSDEQKRADYDSFGGATSSGFNSGFQQQQNPFSQQGRQGNFRWEYKVKPSISLERGVIENWLGSRLVYFHVLIPALVYHISD